MDSLIEKLEKLGITEEELKEYILSIVPSYTRVEKRTAKALENEVALEELLTQYNYDGTNPEFYRDAMKTLLLLKPKFDDDYSLLQVKRIIQPNVTALHPHSFRQEIGSLLYNFGMTQLSLITGRVPYKTCDRMIAGDRTKSIWIELLYRYRDAIKEDPQRIYDDIQKELEARGNDKEAEGQMFDDAEGEKFYWNAQFLTLDDLMEIANA